MPKLVHGLSVVLPDGRTGVVVRLRESADKYLYMEVNTLGGGRVCVPLNDCKLQYIKKRRKRTVVNAIQLEFPLNEQNI